MIVYTKSIYKDIDEIKKQLDIARMAAQQQHTQIYNNQTEEATMSAEQIRATIDLVDMKLDIMRSNLLSDMLLDAQNEPVTRFI